MDPVTESLISVLDQNLVRHLVIPYALDAVMAEMNDCLSYRCLGCVIRINEDIWMNVDNIVAMAQDRRIKSSGWAFSFGLDCGGQKGESRITCLDAGYQYIVIFFGWRFWHGELFKRNPLSDPNVRPKPMVCPFLQNWLYDHWFLARPEVCCKYKYQDQLLTFQVQCIFEWMKFNHKNKRDMVILVMPKTLEHLKDICATLHDSNQLKFDSYVSTVAPSLR